MKKSLLLCFLLLVSFCAFSQRPLYRYYNAKIKKHYFTINFKEYGNGANGWAYEGVSCRVYPPDRGGPNIGPIFRFFNAQSGDHYYTTGKFITRRDLIGYTAEGPVFCNYRNKTPGTIPLLEYYNAANGDHFYTADKRELGRGFDGYVFDNIAGYVFPRAE